MKKNLKLILICASVVVIVAAVVAAVTLTRKTALAAPSSITYDEDDNLNWSKVDAARSYEVSLTNIDTGKKTSLEAKKETLSLSGIEEGDYSVKVKSVAAKGSKYKDSDWKELSGYFRKYREIGCLYNSAEGGTAFKLTKVGSAKGDIVIDATYRDKPVIEISDSAFKGSTRVTSIVIEDGIKKIGKDAFYNCNKLESIIIPDSVTSIGQYAFMYSRSLRSIKLPENITVIETGTFSYCTDLQSVEFNENLKTIGNQAFSYCGSLVEVVVPDSVETIGSEAFESSAMMSDSLESVVLGENLKTIGDKAFAYRNSLKTVVFSDSGNLEEIGTQAFIGCTNLESAELKTGLKTIRNYAFFGCKKLSLEGTDGNGGIGGIPETVTSLGYRAFYETLMCNFVLATTGDTANDYLYIDNWVVGAGENLKKTLTAIGEKTETNQTSVPFKEGTVGIADYAFANKTWTGSELNNAPLLRSVNLQKSVKYIGREAFCNNEVLDTFSAQDSSLEYIGKYAFNGCTALTNLFLNNGKLTEIDSFAFYNCSSLFGSNIIPSSVTKIGQMAFKKTGNWNNVTNGIVLIDNWVMGINGTATEVTIPDSVNGKSMKIADYAFYKVNDLTKVNGLENVSYIGNSAFRECSSLEKITLDPNLRKIEDYAFFGCENAVIGELPGNIEEIGNYAFYNCKTAIKDLDLSYTKLKKIGDYAFFGCSGIETIDLSSPRLTSIGAYAFYGCSNIKAIDIPDTVTELGVRAFNNCINAKTLYIGSGLTEINDYAFVGCGSLLEIVIPDTITKIGRNAFYNCSDITTLKLGKNVKSIGAYAFSGLASLTSLEIPASVTEIGDYAFKGLKSVESVVISNNIESLGLHSLYGISKATFYIEASSIKDGWNKKFNSSNRPVIWGCTLDEEKLYVVSVEVKDGFITNQKAEGGITAPERAGYTFKGWSKAADKTTIDYSAADIANAKTGEVLYAVWEPAADTPSAE